MRSPIHQISADDWESYWNEQIETAKDVFEDTISNYNGVGGSEFLNLILEDAVKSGNDLEQISGIIKSFTDNTELQDGVNKYWESLSNPNADSENALKALSNQLDELKKKYPEITDSVNTFYETLQKGNKTPISTEGLIQPFEDVTTDLTSQIKNLQSLSDGFEIIDKIYADVKDKGSFDYTNLADDKFIETFQKYETEYNNFIKTVSSSPTDIQACQSAFNDLVTAWVDGSGALSKLDAANLQVAKDMLTNMGVTNSAEVVNDRFVQSIMRVKTSTQEYQKAAADENAELSDLVDTIVYTEDEKEALIAIHPELRNQFDQTKKGIQLEESAYESLGISVESLRVAQIQAQIEQTQSVITGVNSRIEAYKIELTAIKSLATALSAINNTAVNSAVFSATDYQDYKQMREIEGVDVPELTAEDFNTLKQQTNQVMQLGNAYDELNKIKIESANINYGGGKKTKDNDSKGSKGSSKTPKEYDDHREYSDYYDEILATRQQDIARIEADNESLNYKLEKALEDGDIATATALKNSINDNLETIKGLRSSYSAELRNILNNDIMGRIVEIGGQFGFDFGGMNIDEISDVDIEKVNEKLQAEINRQKDIGVDMQNAEKGDNAYNIKTAELAKTEWESLIKTAESYNDVVGNLNGEGEYGLKWLEEQGEQLENNLSLQEKTSELIQKQADDIEHQIDLQRNALNGDDASVDNIKNAISLRKQQQKLYHKDAMLWREYYEALGMTAEQIEKMPKVQEAQKSWWDAEKQIFELYNEAIEKSTKAMEMQIATLEYEYEQENLIIDALEKKYQLQRQLREARREIKAEYEASRDIIAIAGDDGTLFNKDDYDTLNKELKKIDSSLTTLYEDYTKSISALGEDEWFKQQQITNEFERQQEALLDQYEIAKQQLEVSRQRTKMENIANEKNKRMLIGGKWVQTPDLQAMYEAKKELVSLEDEEYELRREAAENKELNALRNLNDSTETEAKAIQNRIDMINKMTSQERKALAEELLKVDDMDNILDDLSKRTLPDFVKVIKDVIDNLGGLADVETSSSSSSGGGGGSIVKKTSSAVIDTVSNVVNKVSSGLSNLASKIESGEISKEPKHHTGRIRGLTPDEERVIVTKDESILTPAQLSPIAQKLMNATDLIEQLRNNTGLLSPTLPSFNIPNVVKNDNSSSQNVYIDNIVVKEPVQDMNGLLHSVMQEAKLYHLRTKNIR